MLRRPLIGILCLGFLAVATAEAAGAISFTCVRNAGFTESECLIGEAQFSAELSDLGGGQALLTFSNSGPTASIIADVYIDDGAGVIGGIASIQNGAGTSFSVGATPPNLPGGNEVSPDFVANFSADANAPTGTDGNGVDPGESVGLVLNLGAGVTFAVLEDAIETGGVRLGIHGQGLGSTGGSESFVSGGGGAVPEPGAALLFGLGAATVARRHPRPEVPSVRNRRR
jgi:hypothetical protein